MKKIALLLAAMLMLAGCGGKKNTDAEAPKTPAAVENAQEEEIKENTSDKENKFPRTPFPAFETDCTDGSSFSSDDFADNKVTMLNYWATWCGPCVGELPYLQQISEEYVDKGFCIVGMIDPYSSRQDVDLLAEQNGITYRLINYFDAFASLDTGYMPTTYFIDSDGNIMGEAFIGGKSYEDWKELIDEILADAD